MNIKSICNFLKKAENKVLFKELHTIYPLSINQIQALVTENPEKPVRDLLIQIRLQQKLKYKIPDAERYLFTEKGAEQCSSTAIANYNGSKFREFRTVADLCCGIGMDLLSIAPRKKKVYAVDNAEQALNAAKYNCRTHGFNNIDFRYSEAESFTETVEAVFLDPDRRKGGKRTIKAENYSPSYQHILGLNNKYPNMAVKLSPLFDYDAVELPEKSTLEFVSERGTLKEILLCTGKLSTAEIGRKAVLLPAKIILEQNLSAKSHVSDIREYIFEPDPAIIRGGLVEDLAVKMGISMISRRSALLTSRTPTEENYGKLYKVVEVLPYSFKKLQNYIRSNKIGNLVIKTRGFAESVESLRKKLKLKGKEKSTILIVKLADQHKMLILSRNEE